MRGDKSGKVYFDEKDIIKRLFSLEVEGEGTINNPYIVNVPFKFPEKSVLSKCSLYIKFINQEFQGLGLERTKNITFEKCSFIILDLTHSTCNQVIDSNINNFILVGGYDNDFINCQIEEVPQNILSYNNRFIGCKLSDEARGLLLSESGFLSLDFIPQILRLMVLFLGISFLSSIITSLFGIWDWISVIVFGGAFFGVFVLYLYLRKILVVPEEKPRNQIIENR